MELLEGIYTRRSIRQYTDQPVDRDQVIEIIRAGMWAPSGLNNQPWRFVIIRSTEVRRKLASLTRYHTVIETAQVCIAVFIDKSAMYNEVKDHQSMGACLENMLLAAHGLGLGAVWLGEILKSGDAVRKLLGVEDSLDLMAVVAIGHPAVEKRSSQRKDISEVLLKEL